MSREYCSKCQAVQNMILTNTDTFEKDDKGNDVKVTTTSYQCSVCNIFVRSEERKKVILSGDNPIV